MPTKSMGGACCFVSFVDDHSRKIWVYLLKSKDEAFAAFKKFHAFVTTQTGRKLKCLRTDNGGEFTSAEFNKFCENLGMKRELTVPYSPSSNGVAERYNRTLCERMRCMLSTSNLSHGFWGEALKTAVHICNRFPRMSLKDDIPEEVWSDKLASYDHLRIFGCEAFVHMRPELRSKLDAKSIKGLFMGYGEEGESVTGFGYLNSRRLEELQGVWNTRCDCIHRPIHAGAHLLHPLWRSEEQYENEELEQGLQEYFLTWAARDMQMLRRLEDDLLLFRNRSLSFGRPTAELRGTQLQPVSWWEKYGSCAPTLKRLAIRSLSQDCSSGPCERNWSTWALFHTKKRNRLSTAQLERLVYCHCNLRLLDHTTSSLEPRQVNVDKIDIEKVKDIPDIPREELDIYTMLYEEMSAPAHQTRASSRRSRSARGGASTSAAVPSTSSLGNADEGGDSETYAASASASSTGSDADAEDADSEDADAEEVGSIKKRRFFLRNVSETFLRFCQARNDLSRSYDYGPFQVCDKISDVAYKLKLPEGWKIHNAFHVSLLRPFVGDVSEDMVPEEQPEVEELDEILVPEQILAHKDRKVRGKVTRCYLVKFKNYSPMDAKWMEEAELVDSPRLLQLYLEAFQLQPTVT
ncbi:hypothetical protein L7F22_013513 [Adiantum nelumboides]|nr:hypothetical protein [Adiantum nelumboides]